MRSPETLPERILKKYVEKPDNACWLWFGARNEKGYGRVWYEKRVQAAHRVLYKCLVGPISHGLVIDHLCRNRQCVNPAHLEPVTPKVNSERGEPASRTCCPHGHPYDEKNTYRRACGKRLCRMCAKLKQREKQKETKTHA